MRRILLEEESVMLAREVQVDVLERWVRAVELPDYVASHARDFVYSTHVSSRDQVIALCVLVNRVDVEEVPRCVSRHAVSACVSAVDACVGEAGCYVVQRTPLKEQLSCLHVDLLEYAVMYPADARTDTEST